MDQQEFTIYSIPLPFWKQVFVRSYKHLVTLKLQTHKYHTAFLRRFCALKNASKQLNKQFDDKFFLETITSRHELRCLKAVYVRKRIHFIIKYGDYYELNAFVLVGKKYGIIPSLIHVLEGSLPLVAEYADPAMIVFLARLQFNGKRHLQFEKRAITTAIRRANERKDNDMTLMLFSRIVVHLQNVAIKTVERVDEALQEGKKLNFDNVIGFDEIFATDPLRTNELLLALIQDQAFSMKLIIPEGNLLRLNSRPSKNKFNKELSNFYVKKTSMNRCTIFYRNRQNTAHYETTINCKNINGDSIIYSYEDKETDNLYELILRTSLFEKMFGEYPRSFIAVTNKVLNLPLEEQPWFFGNISDAKVNALATESPNTCVFFTYSRFGHVFFKWTNTLASKKKIEPEVVTNVARHLPKDQFILGLLNYSKPKGLAEHLAWKYILLGDLDRARQHIADNNINCQILFNDPNIISVYLEDTPKQKINDDLILWLIEQGVSLGEERDGAVNFALINAILKCREKTVNVMIQKLGCSNATLKMLLSRRPSYDLLKLCYKSILSRKTAHTYYVFQDFLTAVDKETVQVNSYTKRTLIMLAWKYGNSENYFKLLPLELVEQILSYEEIDEPAYYDMLKLFMEHIGLASGEGVLDWHFKHVILFLPFMSRHPQYFNADIHVNFLRKISMASTRYFESKRYGPALRYWFQRIYTSDRIHLGWLGLDLSSLSSMTQYCLESRTEEALSLLKFLLKHGITRKKRLTKTYLYKVTRSIPATWLAVYSRYLPTIKYLLDEDMLPERSDDKTAPIKLSDVLNNDPKLKDVKEYIEKYREELKKRRI